MNSMLYEKNRKPINLKLNVQPTTKQAAHRSHGAEIKIWGLFVQKIGLQSLSISESGKENMESKNWVKNESQWS